MKNKEVFIFYCILFALVGVRTRWVISKASPESDYTKELHHILATIMMYHMLIATGLLVLDLEVANTTWFSVCNTVASILSAVAFYKTDRNNRKMRYIWNFVYLFFASVLMGEVWVYLGMRHEIIYGAGLVFLIFLVDIVSYRRDRRKMLILFYIACTIAACANGYLLRGPASALCFALNGIYGLAVVIWMYYDHDRIASDSSRYHLEDALKYFYDVEGMIVRYINARSDKKN